MQIAEQYGLTPKALLALNPAYDANPMSLAVGHSLNVKVVEASQKESPFDTPPVPMGTYNHALNVHYDFSERFLSGTHIQSINSERLLSDDIPVVRLADFTPNRVFAKSCEQPEGCIDAGVSDEPIHHFGPWAFFFGQAHANPMVGRAIQTQQAIQAAQTHTALATSGGMVGDNLREKPLSELDKAGIQLEKVAGNLAESWLEGYRLKSPTIGALFILGQQLYGDDTQYTDDELRQEKTVQSRVRIHLTDPKEGEYYPSVRAYHTDDTRIPVRYAREENGQYSVMLEGDQPLVWTPIDEGDPSRQTTPDHDDGFEPDSIVVTPIPDTENATTTLPIPEEGDWRDTVVVFPESTGIPPLYVVYTQQPRDEKGQFASTGEPKPKLDRPSLRAETKRQIEARAKRDENGNFVDPNNQIIEDWQYGHKKGLENRRVLRAAEELEMSQKELNDFVNSRPDYYQIEDRITNLSHVNEKPGHDDLDDIQDDMIEFLEERRNR